MYKTCMNGTNSPINKPKSWRLPYFTYLMYNPNLESKLYFWVYKDTRFHLLPLQTVCLDSELPVTLWEGGSLNKKFFYLHFKEEQCKEGWYIFKSRSNNVRTIRKLIFMQQLMIGLKGGIWEQLCSLFVLFTIQFNNSKGNDPSCILQCIFFKHIL